MNQKEWVSFESEHVSEFLVFHSLGFNLNSNIVHRSIQLSSRSRFLAIWLSSLAATKDNPYFRDTFVAGLIFYYKRFSKFDALIT